MPSFLQVKASKIYGHALRKRWFNGNGCNYIMDDPGQDWLVRNYDEHPYSSMCPILDFAGRGFGLANRTTLMVNPAIDKKNSKGFTLIEIVITIVIVGIISGIAAVIIAQGVRSYSDEQDRSDMRYRAGLALERMSREIRMIRSASAADIPIMTGSILRYTDINGAAMGFRLNAGAIERTEDNGATWNPLATNITAPGGNLFTYLDSAGSVTGSQASLWFVQIEFTATQGAETETFRSSVHPRNF